MKRERERGRERERERVGWGEQAGKCFLGEGTISRPDERARPLGVWAGNLVNCPEALHCRIL